MIYDLFRTQEELSTSVGITPLWDAQEGHIGDEIWVGTPSYRMETPEI